MNGFYTELTIVSPTSFWSTNKSKLKLFFANNHSFGAWCGKHQQITFGASENTLEKIIAIRSNQVEEMKKRVEQDQLKRQLKRELFI